MKEHKLKTYPKEFQAIWDDNKLFEIRKNDRDFKLGDKLILKEYFPEENMYSERYIECDISYIAIGPEWELPYDLVVMGIKAVKTFDPNSESLKFDIRNFDDVKSSLKECKVRKSQMLESESIRQLKLLPLEEILEEISKISINNRYIITDDFDNYSKLLKEKLDAGGELTYQEKCYLPENICDNKECKHSRRSHLDEAYLKGEEKSNDRGWCTKPEGSCIFGNNCKCLKFIEPNV